jgi:hypothetical protein
MCEEEYKEPPILESGKNCTFSNETLLLPEEAPNYDQN